MKVYKLSTYGQKLERVIGIVVTSPLARIKKFEAKITADRVRQRYGALKEDMVESATGKFANLANVQAYVKQVVLNEGLPPELTLPFMRIALKILGMQNVWSGTTFENEAKLYLNYVYCKEKDVLANTQALARIVSSIASYFGITWNAPSKCYAPG